MHVATGKGLEALAVGELEIHLAAMRVHQTEGVELAGSAVVDQRAEVAPVDLEALAGGRFHAHIGAAGGGVLTYRAKVILDDREAAVVSERAQTLCDHRCIRSGILPQQIGDGRLEGIELAGAIAACASGRRSF